MTDIFVSYKSDDREVVHDIVKALEGEGFSVWWDQGIAPSSDWRATITEKLQAARCVLVVWSTNSIDNRTSRWVLEEAEAADQRDVYVPVSIDDVVPPLGLGHIQSADLIDWRGDTKDPRWLALVEVVRAKIEGRSADTASAHRWEPADLGQVLKGRWPIVALLFGLASLVVAISLNFGITHAIGVVVGIASLYAALNALLARRMNERAASTFFRRLLRPSPVTYSAIAIVWLAVALVAASPLVRSMLYADFSVTVVDEVSRPVTGAIVVIDSQTGSESVTLDGQAIARVAYFSIFLPRRARESYLRRSHRRDPEQPSA